jgi:putative flippase GtrA
MTPPDTAPAAAETPIPTYTGAAALLRRNGLRQFVKFCIVGASSTLIDFGIYLSLIELLHIQSLLGSMQGGRILAQCCSFVFAVTNGFIWNSRWTFRHLDREGMHQRYFKFVVTNLIGLGLNLGILTLVSHNVPPALQSYLDAHLHDPAGFVGKLAAVFVVVFWNFSASKYWTFRR